MGTVSLGVRHGRTEVGVHLRLPRWAEGHDAFHGLHIHANDDPAGLRFTTGRLTRSDLRVRAVVVHAGPDNFGNVPLGTAADQYTANSPAAVAKTAGTGNSGDRLACGVISLDGDD